jgi:potassium efflux system protein
MNLYKTLSAQAGQLPRKTLFLLLLSMVAIVALLVSLLVRFVVDMQTSAHPVKLAVIAPLSGPAAGLGRSLRQGAELFAGQFNRQRKLGESPIELLILDEAAAADRKALIERAAAAGVVGVIGHPANSDAREAEAWYEAQGLPAITPAADQEARYPEQPWLFRSGVDSAFEIRFLANYVRNVLGEKNVNIVYPNGLEGERQAALYDETMQRFGTKVLYKWGYEADGPDLAERVRGIAAEIGQQKLIGYLLVLGNAADSARIVAGLRTANVRNRVIGPRILATRAFLDHLKEDWQGPGSLASLLNSTLLTAPLLFDMAGEAAQQVRTAYIAAYGDSPDWLAMQGYDAARALGESARELGLEDARPIAERRRLLRQRLMEMDRVDRCLGGANGPFILNPKRNSTPPTLAGVYDGTELVSSLTQLTPIDAEASVNYLQEVVDGRALYVNDRFMYKTNVVYTGVKVNEVAGLDPKSNVAELQFWLWFRWRGKVEPQDVVFTNAAADIALDKPEREGQDGDMRYRVYRVRGKFYLNYTDSERTYGNQLVGVSFLHRDLGNNNLLYVTDVLGMNLVSARTLTDKYQRHGLLGGAGEGGGGALSKVLGWFGGGGKSGGPDFLTALLKQERVLTPLTGWAIENAWISQETARRGALGNPLFVGFGKQQPSFSKIDHGILLKPDTVRLRDFIPVSAFAYIAIFAFLLAVLAEILDHRPDQGNFWRAQALGLRLLGWPLLLLSIGNLTLDYSLLNWPTQTTQTVETAYLILWWLVPAKLLCILIRQFLWNPLERRAKRKVPDSVKSLTTFTVYLFATFGITAFVFGQAVTSLLATTGATAMIVGLAVKANIDNIFSGIVLNIERPFNIGDLITYDKLLGKVVDISWRTTQVQGDNGSLVTIPNSKVSAAQLTNHTRAAFAKSTVSIEVPPHHDPARVQALIESCLPGNPHFLPAKPGQEPKVFFRGVRFDNGWRAQFDVTIYTQDPKDAAKKAAQELWRRVWQRFGEENIDWDGRGIS